MVRLWLTSVSVLVIVIAAPGTTPALSRTVPEILPRVSCASAVSGIARASEQALTQEQSQGSLHALSSVMDGVVVPAPGG